MQGLVKSWEPTPAVSTCKQPYNSVCATSEKGTNVHLAVKTQDKVLYSC